MLDYKKFRAEQAEPRASRAGYLGIGFSTYIEACGDRALQGGRRARRPGRASGSARKVRVHPTGKVTVFTGSHSHGQGHETTFAQLVADELRHPDGRRDRPRRHRAVPVRHGHLRQPLGRRWAAPRIYMCAREDQGEGQEDRRAPARGDAEATSSTQAASSRSRARRAASKTFGEVALMAYLAHNLPKGLEPGLEATSFFDPGNFVLPLRDPHRVVEVERETGKVKLAALRGGGRRRQRDQPDDRRRHGARRHRPGRRAGALGGRGVRRRTASSMTAA